MANELLIPPSMEIKLCKNLPISMRIVKRCFEGCSWQPVNNFQLGFIRTWLCFLIFNYCEHSSRINEFLIRSTLEIKLYVEPAQLGLHRL